MANRYWTIYLHGGFYDMAPEAEARQIVARLNRIEGNGAAHMELR